MAGDLQFLGSLIHKWNWRMRNLPHGSVAGPPGFFDGPSPAAGHSGAGGSLTGSATVAAGGSLTGSSTVAAGGPLLGSSTVAAGGSLTGSSTVAAGGSLLGSSTVAAGGTL